MNTIQMTDKLYFAFYSEKAQSHFRADGDKTGVCKYRLADGSGEVNTTAVYLYSQHSSAEEVLKNHYLFDDAVFVGIVDKWLQTYYK